jgi:ribonuclease D
MGRHGWAEEEFAGFLNEIGARSDSTRWRRLPGLHQLNRRGLEITRRLSDWRSEEARRLNRPVRQILRDDLLIAVAKRQPATRQELEALRDFNRPHLLSRSAEILAAVSQAQAVPADQLPEHNERHEEGPGLTMVVNLLAAALANCCARQKLAASLVGSTNDLKDLTRWHTQGRPESARPALARGWRGEVCGEFLLDVLAGRSALRVTDPLAEVPVAVETLTGLGPGESGLEC